MKLTILIGIFLLLNVPEMLFGQMRVDRDGRVGIGTTSPLARLHIQNGNVRITSPNYPLFLASHALDPRIQTAPGRYIVFYNVNNTGFNAIQVGQVQSFSDGRAKEDVQRIGQEKTATALINDLEGVSFQWVDDLQKKRHFGLIAQQVETVLPEIVHTTDSNNYKLIAYQELIPILIEAFKEQQIAIESLKEQRNTLTSRAASLKRNRVLKTEKK